MQVSDVEITLETFHGSHHLTSLLFKVQAFKFYWCMCSQVFIFANLLWLLIHWRSWGAEAGHLGVNGSILIDKWGEGDVVNMFSGRHRNWTATLWKKKEHHSPLNPCTACVMLGNCHSKPTDWMWEAGPSVLLENEGCWCCMKKKQRKSGMMASFRPNSWRKLQIVAGRSCQSTEMASEKLKM